MLTFALAMLNIVQLRYSKIFKFWNIPNYYILKHSDSCLSHADTCLQVSSKELLTELRTSSDEWIHLFEVIDLCDLQIKNRINIPLKLRLIQGYYAKKTIPLPAAHSEVVL